jgi:hypothetical protein
MAEGTVETSIALGSDFCLIMHPDEKVFAISIAAFQNDRFFPEFFAENLPFFLVFDFRGVADDPCNERAARRAG